MTPSRRHLVFDVGGTQLRAAVYDALDAALLDVARVDAPSFMRHPDAPWSELRALLLEAMSGLRARLDPDATIRSVAVAFPGPLDGSQRVLAAPTLWGDQGVYPYDLGEDLREAWTGVTISVMNDVTAAGYRYLGAPDDDFCVVAVSTGIGNKVFVSGRPLLGRDGVGGEIGHLQVDASPAAPACDCGGRGHVGAIASGRGASARARERDPRGADWTAEALAEAYRGGDAFATSILREASDALGFAFAAIHLAVGVDRFVLIGGFAMGLGSAFCDDVRAAADARCWRGGRGPVRVSLGAADGQCALVGAGRARELALLP